MNTVLEKLRERFERLINRFAGVTTHSPTIPTLSAVSGTSLPGPDEEVMVAEEIGVLLPAKVILYNDEIHTFEEVIVQLVRATGCSTSEAEALAFEVDTRGFAVVYEGEMDRCLRVSSVLEEIALHTSIEM